MHSNVWSLYMTCIFSRTLLQNEKIGKKLKNLLFVSESKRAFIPNAEDISDINFFQGTTSYLGFLKLKLLFKLNKRLGKELGLKKI